MSPSPKRRAHDIIQRLLAAAGAGAPAEGGEVAAADYDWTAPCRFSPTELARLDQFARAAASGISDALGKLLRMKVELVSTGMTQHFAARLPQPETVHYWAELRQAGDPCGLIALTADVAVRWVAGLLGAEASSQRELSSVENDLLLDIATAVAGAFSQVAAGAGCQAFSSGEKLSKGEYSLPGNQAEDYCRFALAAAGADAEPCVSLLVRGDLVAPAGGTGEQTPPMPPEEVRKSILCHLEDVPIAATVRLGRAKILVRELVELEAGDVLLIDTKDGQQVELLVQERSASWGFPAVCKGRYALQIGSLPVQPQG